MYTYCPEHDCKDFEGKSCCPKCHEEFKSLPEESREPWKFVDLRFLPREPEFIISRFKPWPGRFRSTLRRAYLPTQTSIKRMEKFIHDHREELDDLEISLLHFPTIEFYFEPR
jgi:hypothetical protein